MRLLSYLSLLGSQVLAPSSTLSPVVSNGNCNSSKNTHLNCTSILLPTEARGHQGCHRGMRHAQVLTWQPAGHCSRCGHTPHPALCSRPTLLPAPSALRRLRMVSFSLLLRYPIIYFFFIFLFHFATFTPAETVLQAPYNVCLHRLSQ